jgi:ERCC4-type nuclease
MKQLVIQIDTREQYPLLFPDTITVPDENSPHNATCILKIKQEKIKLDSGDYRLAEFPKACVIERKGSQSELIKNLFDPQDAQRTARSLTRLRQSCIYPYLLLECTPSSLLAPTPLLHHPELLINKLTLMVARFGLHMLWTTTPTSVGARRSLGTIVLHTLYALRNKLPDYLPQPESIEAP